MAAAVNSGSGCLILMYHGIVEAAGDLERPYCCPPELFSLHLEFLRSEKYEFITISDLHNSLGAAGHEGQNPSDHKMAPKTVALTFDDGYRSVYENAFPLLQRHGILATFFIVSDLVGQSNRWEIDGFPIRSLMTWPQIRELADHGMEIGGHGRTHPRLTGIDEKSARDEIAGCKRILEEHLGEKIRHFAYPFGAISGAVRDLVNESGFSTGCGVAPGFNNSSTDPFILRRIEVLGTDSVSRLRRKLISGTNDPGWSLLLKRIKKRLIQPGKRALWRPNQSTINRCFIEPLILPTLKPKAHMARPFLFLNRL